MSQMAKFGEYGGHGKTVSF